MPIPKAYLNSTKIHDKTMPKQSQNLGNTTRKQRQNLCKTMVASCKNHDQIMHKQCHAHTNNIPEQYKNPKTTPCLSSA